MKPEVPPGRPLRSYEYVLALMPFLLVLSGVRSLACGAVGLAIGPAACAANLAAMRAVSSRLVRAALAIAIAFIAFMLWGLVLLLF